MSFKFWLPALLSSKVQYQALHSANILNLNLLCPKRPFHPNRHLHSIVDTESWQVKPKYRNSSKKEKKIDSEKKDLISFHGTYAYCIFFIIN